MAAPALVTATERHCPGDRVAGLPEASNSLPRCVVWDAPARREPGNPEITLGSLFLDSGEPPSLPSRIGLETSGFVCLDAPWTFAPHGENTPPTSGFLTADAVVRGQVESRTQIRAGATDGALIAVRSRGRGARRLCGPVFGVTLALALPAPNATASTPRIRFGAAKNVIGQESATRPAHQLGVGHRELRGHQRHGSGVGNLQTPRSSCVRPGGSSCSAGFDGGPIRCRSKPVGPPKWRWQMVQCASRDVRLHVRWHASLPP